MLEYVELLYDATRSPLGIVLETNDPERLRQRLYAIRKDNPDFEALSFLISPFNSRDLWVLNRAGKDSNE